MYFCPLQNRFYVATKLRTDLSTELRALFVTLIADRHVPALIRKLTVKPESRVKSVKVPCCRIYTRKFMIN